MSRLICLKLKSFPGFTNRVDLSATIHVEWDIETETGSITIGDESFCWNEDKTGVGC